MDRRPPSWWRLLTSGIDVELGGWMDGNLEGVCIGWGGVGLWFCVNGTAKLQVILSAETGFDILWGVGRDGFVVLVWWNDKRSGTMTRRF